MHSLLFIALLFCALQSISCTHSIRRTLFSGQFSIETMPPTVSPTIAPTIASSAAPTIAPTIAPTTAPTFATSISPTVAPSIMPTVAPSSSNVATIMTFASTQTLVNCTDFYGNVEAEYTFKETVVDATMVGGVATITTDNVFITGTTTTSASRRVLVGTSVGNLIVNYNITLDVTTSSFATPQAAYSSISTTLVASVNSNQFTALLESNAASNSVPLFAYTTSTSITESPPLTIVVDTFAPTVAPTSGGGSSSSADNTLAIALGVTFGVLFIAVILFFFGRNIFFCLDAGEADLKKEIAREGHKSFDNPMFQGKDDYL